MLNPRIRPHRLEFIKALAIHGSNKTNDFLQALLGYVTELEDALLDEQGRANIFGNAVSDLEDELSQAEAEIQRLLAEIDDLTYELKEER